MERREVEKIIEQLIEQGWKVTLNGHYRCVPPDKSKPVVFMSQTPSDWRAIRNMKSFLRKLGVKLT